LDSYSRGGTASALGGYVSTKSNDEQKG
jgi:hypothetical protein